MKRAEPVVAGPILLENDRSLKSIRRCLLIIFQREDLQVKNLFEINMRDVIRDILPQNQEVHHES